MKSLFPMLLGGLLALLAIGTSALAADRSVRTRRVLYNSDGDSCMFTRPGGKGSVAVTLDDVRHVVDELTYEGSQVRHDPGLHQCPGHVLSDAGRHVAWDAIDAGRTGALAGVGGAAVRKPPKVLRCGR